MDKYPIKYFSRAGQSSSKTIKILQNPMDVFQNLTKKVSSNQAFSRNSARKIDIEEILKTAAVSSTKVIKKLCLAPTSSFRCQSREDWYRPYHRDPSPPCAYYNPIYSLTERRVPSPRYLPVSKKVKSRKDRLSRKYTKEVSNYLQSHKERTSTRSKREDTILLLQKNESLNKTK